MTTDLVAMLVLLVLCLAIVLVGRLLVRRRLSNPVRLTMVIVALAGLFAMLISDWPTQALSQFWSEHSVLSAMLVTVLLAGAAYLVYDYESERRQERLNESLTAAGLGGLVDHLLTVAVVLDMLARGRTVDLPHAYGKPLRWARPLLGQAGHRLEVTDSGGQLDPGYTRTILDQCLRRLMAGIRDWSPLLLTTRTGTEALVLIGQLRVTLHQIVPDVDAPSRQQLTELSREAAELAVTFEMASEARSLRDEFMSLPATASLKDYHVGNEDYRRALRRLGRGRPVALEELAPATAQVSGQGTFEPEGWA